MIETQNKEFVFYIQAHSKYFYYLQKYTHILHVYRLHIFSTSTPEIFNLRVASHWWAPRRYLVGHEMLISDGAEDSMGHTYIGLI